MQKISGSRIRPRALLIVSPSWASAQVAARATALVALIAAGTGAAQAQEADYAPVAPFRSIESYVDLRSSVSRTDNVFRTESNKTSDTLGSLGVGLDFRHDGRKLDVDARGDLDWIDYLDNSFGSKAFGYFNGNATWGEPTDFFQWVARETFGQLLGDPLAAVTPDNVENVNYFSTGPTFTLPLGNVGWTKLLGLYSKSSYAQSDFNSDSLLGGLAFGHELSSSSRLSLNGTTEHTSFDNSANPDYDVQQYFVHYEAAGARTTIDTDLGYTTLHEQGHSDSGLLARLRLGRRVSQSSSIYIRGSDERSSAGQSLRGGTATGGVAGASVLPATADPFRERTYELGWRFSGSRTDVSLLVSHVEDTYERQVSLNNTGTTYSGTFERRLQPTLTLSLIARRDSRHYDALGKYDETNFTAELAKLFGRLGVSLRYERYDRTGSQVGTGTPLGYTENRAGLRLTYALLRGQ